jgi:hypothetical protein
VGRTARTAASFCVFLTLGLTFATATFFATAFRAVAFATTFLAFVAGLALAAAFFAGRSLAGFRAGTRALVALLAFGLADDFAFTVRFAVFDAVCLAFEREADRLKPFVRLLLMG